MRPPPAWLFAASSCALLAAACGSEAPQPARPTPQPAPLTTAEPAASGTASAEEGDAPAADAAFRGMLNRVSKVRGLSVLSPVELRIETRARMEQMIRAKAERELPHDVLLHETEALVALGLVSPSYDATEGMFSMIGASISGFYEPADKTMYLAADLSRAERDETLAHELVHALQDQHYDLAQMFKYSPDTEEISAAGHALAEGDATSAMFDVARRDVMGVKEDDFTEVAFASIEKLAPDVPAVLRESLISSYTDGYAFVQAMRRRGGFAAVDAAWRARPATTEQLLHLDKYDAKEPMIAVEPAPLAPLAEAKSDRRFSQVYTQMLGEQGLRAVLAAWTDRAEATLAAAGWGGDRYVLAHGEGAAAGEIALAWHIVMDAERDAEQVAAVVSAQAHGDCVARPDTGPFAWLRKKREVALVMGPYARSGKKVTSSGSCKEARRWLATILAPKKRP
jgi:hypothetical protein